LEKDIRKRERRKGILVRGLMSEEVYNKNNQ